MSIHASGSAMKSTAATRKSASGSSSAVRCSRSPPASAPTRVPASVDRSATSPISSSHRGSRSTAHATVMVAARETSISARIRRSSAARRRRGDSQRWQAAVEQGRAGLCSGVGVPACRQDGGLGQCLLTAVRAGGATFDLRLQAVRLGDVVLAGMNVETFFETGIEIRWRSPLPDTFVLGYTRRLDGLSAARRVPSGGRLEARRAVCLP